MSRAKLLRLSVRLVNSLSSTQQSSLHSLRLNQVTHCSYLTQSLLPKNPQSYNFPPNTLQKLYFSSKPESSVDLILSHDEWSEKIENELEKLNPNVIQEFVVYVLKRLSPNPKKSLDFYKWARDKKGFEPSYEPCSLLLKCLACKEFIFEFWGIASEIREKGLCIDKHIYFAVSEALKRENLDAEAVEFTKFYESVCDDNAINDAVKGIVKVIKGSDWGEGVEDKLEKLNFSLSETVVFRVIWSLRGEPLKSLEFFEWVARSRKYEHNSVTYSRMARVLALGGLMDKFWDLVTRMRSEGCEINGYIKLAKCLSDSDAVKLFELVMDGPYKLSETDCITLLKNLALNVNPDIDLVNRVVNKYVEVGNTRNKALYDTVHRSLCKVGRFEEAKKIVEDMRNAGYKPDNITYSQEVFGHCKLGRFEDAGLVLDQMEADGCVPDLKTWSILIKGYCLAAQMDQALSYFAGLAEKNLEPDADLLEVLLKGFLTNDKVIGAYEFLVETVNKACLKPWQATFKLMIEKLVQDGKIDEGFNLLSLMKEQGYPPYPEPFVRYISKSGTVEDAKKLLRAVPLKGFPSTAVYVQIITAFYNEGRLSEAKDMLHGCPRQVRRQKAIQKLFGSKESEKLS